MERFITRAARLNGPYDIELIEKELICSENDIIVKNQLTGICGSDKNFYRGLLPQKTSEFRQDPSFPFMLGHESGGTVVAVGSKVNNYAVGDHVISFGWNNNYSDYFSAKECQLQPVPEGLDMDVAALGEPIACAMYSGLHCNVQLGDIAVVMGGGFAGQIIAQCAKKKGASTVIVADVLDGKLALAKQLGADYVINPQRQDIVKEISSLTNGKGADVVIEAAGTADSFNTASSVLRHNGSFVFYSWVTQPLTIDISRWHDDGFNFINTCLVHHSWQERYIWSMNALRPVTQGLIQIKPLITNEFALSDLKKGFWLTLIKFIIGTAIGWTVSKLFGPAGFIGLTPLALIAAITNSNGAVYSALAGEYGDATDVGAISILSLNDGPFLTMIALGATGLADIPFKALIAAILPLIIGFILGNIDEDLRSVFSNALPAIIMFSGLALGAGMDLRQVVQAGPSGIVLGLITLISTGLLSYFIYSAILRKRNACGAAIGTTAGNAVATPAAVALADPTLESIAGVATAQVAASTILTAILCPFLVAYLAKRNKRREIR